MFWHRHKSKVTGVYPLERVTHCSGARCPVTEVLLVCDCGAFETRVIDGHWTLEQLQPAPAKVEADREFFRKLGVKI
jgi:hypothetical protein